MEQIIELLCDLVRDEVCAGAEKTFDKLTEDGAKQLYALAKSHDMVHLLSSPIERHAILPDGKALEKFRSQAFSAVYRQNNISYEMNKISALLEDAQIQFIPLKGAVIRDLYPKPWMRTSCDIDILVKPCDIDRAAEVVTAASYERGWKNSHEISFFSKNGVHLELHYRLVGDEKRVKLNSVLDTLWEHTEAAPGKRYQLLLSDEMFYFYHIAHMALHFENGGCGIRPFLDMWLLNHKKTHNPIARKELLAKGGLLKFATGAEALSEAWFGGACHTELTKMLENYIEGAGIYGSESNSVKVKQVQKGGRLKYIVSRIWLPYKSLKYRFPTLEGKRFLTPIYQIRRWCGLMLGNKAKNAANELKKSREVTSEEQREVSELLKEMGL